LRRLFAGAFFAGIVGPADVFAQPSEYAIKAEFIERFTRFIDWPEDAFSGPGAPFVICVIGDNPFGDYLAHLARDRKIKDRPVWLLEPRKLSELDACHIVFIAASESGRVAAIVARVRGKPILTIGDTPGFAQGGVIINFFLERDLVHFEINLDEARRTGLTFSTKLLKLARVVRSGQGGP
jgi:YfiR/HmsC-like